MTIMADHIHLPVNRRTLSETENECVSLITGALDGKATIPSITTQHEQPPNGNIIEFLQKAAGALVSTSDTVATALSEVVGQCTLHPNFGGYGLSTEAILTTKQENDVVFLCSAYLEAVKSEARAQSAPQPLLSRPAGRPGMTMSEKIFAAHDTSRRGWVKAGDVVQVDVDWVMASELSHAVSPLGPISLAAGAKYSCFESVDRTIVRDFGKARHLPQ